MKNQRHRHILNEREAAASQEAEGSVRTPRDPPSRCPEEGRAGPALGLRVQQGGYWA